MNKATSMNVPREVHRAVRVWSSEVRMLAALRERVMGRTVEEVRLWVRHTNRKPAP